MSAIRAWARSLRPQVRASNGRAPGESTELVKKILGDESPSIAVRPTLSPSLKRQRKCWRASSSDEDVLRYTLPQVAEKFFTEREEPENIKYTIEAIE